MDKRQISEQKRQARMRMLNEERGSPRNSEILKSSDESKIYEKYNELMKEAVPEKKEFDIQAIFNETYSPPASPKNDEKGLKNIIDEIDKTFTGCNKKTTDLIKQIKHIYSPALQKAFTHFSHEENETLQTALKTACGELHKGLLESVQNRSQLINSIAKLDPRIKKMCEGIELRQEAMNNLLSRLKEYLS